MQWLSDNLEALLQAPDDQRCSDVVVVGSGYGGSVAALRMADAGLKVCMLERGQEYVAGEFPSDLGDVGKHVRAQWQGPAGVQSAGYEEALFDFRVGQGAAALVGNGLGGGSLINAGVGLQPDAEVFQAKPWPTAIRRTNLGPWFDEARRMLELSDPADPMRVFDMRSTRKYQSLQALHEQLPSRMPAPDTATVGAVFEEVPVAVCLHPWQLDADGGALGPRSACTGCGNCVSGCNEDAKLSLTKTYLPAARRAGARLFTGATVLSVHWDDGHRFPWALRIVRTAERALYEGLRGGVAAPMPTRWVHVLRARHVVLAAGTFGSTEILLRSRLAQTDADGLRWHGLSTSERLGERVSGNGDDVACIAELEAPANALGETSAGPNDEPTGPTISAMIRFRDGADARLSTLVQDGGVPGLLGPVFQELIQTLTTVARLDDPAAPPADGSDDLAPQPQVRTHSLTLLGMGHDDSPARIELDAQGDRVRWLWPRPEQAEAPPLHRARVQAGTGGRHGRYLRNPGSGILPDTLSSLMSGPDMGQVLATVHPLGGCAMADDATQGVCNHVGQVFRGAGGTDVHEGLYVMDGSVIPTSLGVNPMLTITALAERSCAELIAREQAAGGARAPVPSTATRRPLPPPLDPAPRPTSTAGAVPAGASLREVLRGPVAVGAALQLCGPLPSGMAASEHAASLFVKMEVADWAAFLADPRHRAPVQPSWTTKPKTYEAARLRLKLEGRAERTLWVEQGHADLYARRAEPWPVHAGRFVRLGLTYTINRWWPDRGRTPGQSGGWRPSRLWRTAKLLRSTLTMLWQAAEVRVFDYRLVLRMQEAPDQPLYLQGTKVIDGAASGEALRHWLAERVKHGGWPAVERLSIWSQLGELPVSLTDAPDGAGRVLLQGRLRMDLPDIARNLLPQLHAGRDSLTATMAALGYPLLLARGLLRTRFLDFRAPDYAERTVPKLQDEGKDPPAYRRARDERVWLRFPEGWEHLGFPPLHRRAHPDKAPCPPIRLQVRARLDDPAASPVELALVRYRQDDLHVQPRDAQGARRVRALLMMNGFAQSTLPFVDPLMHCDSLAARLYDEGWDLWLLEYRVSPLLEASARFSTMDDIAAFDIPAAVARICEELGEQLGMPPELVRIHAFSHCVGAASLAMSLAGGHLAIAHPDGGEDKIHRLAGVVFSQFQPYVIGSNSAQQRLQLGAFMNNVLGREYLEFAAGVGTPDVLHGLLDRVFATMPHPDLPCVPRGEACPHQDAGCRHAGRCPHKTQACPHESDLRLHQPDTTTCKRMSGLLSPLFDHGRLGETYHARLDMYFGRTNLGVFLHGAKCVEHERLVDNDGRDYLADDKVRQYLDMPIMLMHGSDNQLFDIGSLARSADQLRRVFGEEGPVDPSATTMPRVTAHRLPGFAHFDCTIGRAAAQEVFPRIARFLADAWDRPLAQPPVRRHVEARLPATGPLMGWVRPDEDGGTVVRVWAEFGRRYSGLLVGGLTTAQGMRDGKPWRLDQAWPTRTVVLRTQPGADAPPGTAYPLSILVADVMLPVDVTEAHIDVFGLYTFDGGAAAGAGMLLEQAAPAADALADAGRRWDLEARELAQARLDFEAITSQGAGVVEPAQGATVDRGPVGMARPAPGDVDPPSAKTPRRLMPRVARVALPPEGADADDSPFGKDHLIGPVSGQGAVLDQDFVEALIDRLSAELTRRSSAARSADPATLSRVARELATLAQARVQVADALRRPDDIDTTFYAAACRHPGISGFETARSDGSLAALTAAHAASGEARFMAMLGDQVYADARAGLFDTASELERILPRYRDALGSPGFRALAERLPLYMVLDDHEIVDNWTREQLDLGRNGLWRASTARTAYRAFQRAHGPDPFLGELGASDDLQHHGAFRCGGVSAFLLDTRTARRLGTRTILSTTAWSLLEKWLCAQQRERGDAPKWVMSGSVIAPGLRESAGRPSPRQSDSWQMSPSDRQRFFDLLVRHRIQNVVLLSSDYHCSAVARLEIGPALRGLAIVAPPLHAPMRFANSLAQTVMADERLPIGEGLQVRVEGLGAWDGEGWLSVRQRQLGGGRWRVSLDFQLRGLEERTHMPHTLDVDL
ncbi:alkaline phosphatase D family protein [uncultured Pseudacidovorax sp.]|uniref:alkaline phosphatase D family protein n=1 Tax=uncultured Pseudacidovorax sp. TaxID=679313 RepID=UPI0025CEFD82|nr:alkaline phosphatase D family protein [uncultured Pseudacidovorax sp.]